MPDTDTTTTATTDKAVAAILGGIADQVIAAAENPRVIESHLANAYDLATDVGLDDIAEAICGLRPEVMTAQSITLDLLRLARALDPARPAADPTPLAPVVPLVVPEPPRAGDRPSDHQTTTDDGCQVDQYRLGHWEQIQMGLALAHWADAHDSLDTPQHGNHLRALAHALASDGREMTVHLQVVRHNHD